MRQINVKGPKCMVFYIRKLRKITQKACEEWMEFKNEQPKAHGKEGSKVLLTRQTSWQNLELV